MYAYLVRMIEIGIVAAGVVCVLIVTLMVAI